MENNFVGLVRSLFRERIEDFLNEKCLRKRKRNAFGEIIINSMLILVDLYKSNEQGKYDALWWQYAVFKQLKNSFLYIWIGQVHLPNHFSKYSNFLGPENLKKRYKVAQVGIMYRYCYTIHYIRLWYTNYCYIYIYIYILYIYTYIYIYIYMLPLLYYLRTLCPRVISC